MCNHRLNIASYTLDMYTFLESLEKVVPTVPKSQFSEI
eukprot:SAG11_NODE_12068_length_723_cov_1.144231_1_plen_37_part_01